MIVSDLVGIPWSGEDRPPVGADCVTLAVYAQRKLWGREIPLDMSLDWDEDTLMERSHEISRQVARFAVPVDVPEPGDVGIMETCGYCHLVTFIRSDLVLHTVRGGASRLSRYTAAFRRRMKSTWRIKGVEAWLEPQ